MRRLGCVTKWLERRVFERGDAIYIQYLRLWVKITHGVRVKITHREVSDLGTLCHSKSCNNCVSVGSRNLAYRRVLA